ncbi:thiolase family protein [Corynebacterium flavescens]|uniref:Probable acetyl-CoA acetyltransferase n=2 Tax=Corynebacterium flavescens TaxID=28028 RepID=A0A1L7CK87_CORFL|nr:acetyl-CoA C-acyltransferase [Corynebacterium flavescens]APT86281.1 acetyl-CoA acetyltransferase [Corynebacterium flavescens]KAA8724545.1 acetyl-CoA C-acyltransferase [Corynebacterium flavescens]GEB97955.1 3-ketoacyl-CoA thiolase [Corynebacterium flavescens]
MQDIHFVGAARLPIGKFGGSLSRMSLQEMGIAAAAEAISRSHLEPAEIETAVIANVLPTTPQDLYISRTIALGAGLPDSSTALGVNRLCGSGLQAIVSAAQSLNFGDGTLALAGGVESMSNAPFSIASMRQGKRLGDGVAYDWLTGALTCPFGTGHMGVTAENVAADSAISRREQDEFAAQSQQRAKKAQESGAETEEILSVAELHHDEAVRETDLAKLASLRPAFTTEGTVTAGNSSGLNDGAAAVVLATDTEVYERGLESLGRLVSWGIGGVDPSRMGLGPLAAVPKALNKAGLSLDDIGLIESNEAFAAQAIAVSRGLNFDPDKTNIYGGAIAHGHPIGATGAILAVRMLYALRRHGLRYGLITMCIGGGQGIAVIIENEEA